MGGLLHWHADAELEPLAIGVDEANQHDRNFTQIGCGRSIAPYRGTCREWRSAQEELPFVQLCWQRLALSFFIQSP